MPEYELVNSCVTKPGEKSIFKIIDGSVCFLSISSEIEVSLDTFDDEGSLRKIQISKSPVKIAYCLGQTPDLADQNNLIFHIENSLMHKCKGDQIDLELCDHGTNTFKVHLHVLEFLRQPSLLPMKRESSEEPEENDAAGISTMSIDSSTSESKPRSSAWNHALCAHVLARISSLKVRGNAVFKDAVGGGHQKKQGDESVRPELLQRALLCYARAYQLVQSMNLASYFPAEEALEQTCHQETVGLMRRYKEHQWVGCAPMTYLPPQEIYKDLPLLEFKLIMNVIICKLKAGAYDQVIEQCGRALELRPQTTDKEAWSVQPHDIAKVHLRRAFAYHATDQWDEAKRDLKETLNIQPGNSEAADLLQKVNKKLTAHNEDVKLKMKKFFKPETVKS